MREATRCATFLLVAVGWVACASTTPAPETADEAEPELPPTRIEVTNVNALDVTLFAVRGGNVLRLGLVSSKTSRRFELPELLQHAAAELRFLVDPVGSTEAYLSDAVFVQPGDEITLRVGTTLPQSSISVF